MTEDAVRDKITAIRAGENRTLVFCLRNGKETVKQWKEHEAVHICTEEQKRQISLKNSGRKQSEKMREYWNDGKASDAHRQTVSHLMKEMRARESSARKEGRDG